MFWLVGSVALTALLSAIPTLGVVVATVLFFVQAVSLQRANHQFFEHFTFGHRVTIDVTRSVLMLAMVVAQVTANVVLGPVSALVNVPLYLVVWVVLEWRVRTHFGLLVQGKGPPLWELVVLGAMIAVVALPPVALLVAVLWSWWG